MQKEIDIMLEIPKYGINLNQRNFHFIIIGAGGTGGYLIPNLTRMVGIKNKEGASHMVTIVDADGVENKNLLRQNFTDRDVGKNKAEVMAGRYGRAFSETFYYMDEYIESEDQIIELAQSERHKIPVFIDCVDNNKTRFIIKKGINKAYKTFLIPTILSLTSGNEEFGGQVIFSYKSKDSVKEESPDLIDIFPNLEIGQLPNEESCAERAISAPQNIHTNITAADILFGYVNKILNDIEITDLAYFFDSRTMLRTKYSGRPTHVKQLLSMVDNNGSLKTFLNEDVKDAIYPPTYEEVLTHVEKEIEETPEDDEQIMIPF